MKSLRFRLSLGRATSTFHARVSFVCIAALAIPSCAHIPAGAFKPTDALPLQMRQETFDVVWNRVDKTFWDPAVLKARDWDGVRTRYQPRAIAAESSAEYHRVLNEMLRELQLSHFVVVAPDAVQEAWLRSAQGSGDAGMSLRAIDGEAVVTRVSAGGAAAQAGIRPGFVMDSINGVAIPKSAAELPGAVAIALEGPLGSVVRLAYRDASDAHASVALVRRARAGRFHRIKLFGIPVPGIPSQYAEVESRRLAGGVGYIRWSMFLQSLRTEVVNGIRGMQDAPGIIIDLRGNPGGQDAMGRAVAGLLVHDKSEFVRSRRRDETKTDYIEPSKPIYEGKVIILVDGGSTSAGEQFSAGLQELGRAKIMGERTRGRDLDATFVKLKTGGMMLYAYGEISTPSGVVLEGRGVIPDIAVKLTRAGLLRGRDEPLDAALAAILGTAR